MADARAARPRTPPLVTLSQIAGRIALAALILVLCAIAVFPFYWMFVTSIRPSGQLFEYPPEILPSAGSVFSTYVTIFEDTALGTWLWNSIRVALGTAFLASFIGATMAYALSSFRFRGRGASEYLLLATQMFPGILLAMPMYYFFSKIGLLNSLPGLTLAYLALLVPVATSLLKTFFDGIPVALEEASLIDGASRLGTFFRITLPLSLPGLASTFLFCFIIAWDEYLFAQMFVRQPGNWTVSVGLASFSGEYVTPWDQVMTAATIVTLPAAVVFLFLQRYLVHGLTAGGVKG
jgi:ABC-type glycerol-3-phosphate transport system permease component